MGARAPPTFGGERHKIFPNFFQFAWSFSNVYSLILAPCADPVFNCGKVGKFISIVNIFLVKLMYDHG